MCVKATTVTRVPLFISAPTSGGGNTREVNTKMALDNPFILDGRNAVITGGGGRIGGAIAHRLTAQGATVVLVDVNPDSLASTTESITETGGVSHSVVGDVSSPDGVSAIMSAVLAKVPQLDILVNNAGPRVPHFPRRPRL